MHRIESWFQYVIAETLGQGHKFWPICRGISTTCSLQTMSRRILLREFYDGYFTISA
ncbi:hypothetical protein B0G80_5434 [Paraburkholderia sp. BL6669N2]|nr:hypothetical protein B0G80_5434 [Paraburkholderia sp. BL6669N2]